MAGQRVHDIYFNLSLVLMARSSLVFMRLGAQRRPGVQELPVNGHGLLRYTGQGCVDGLRSTGNVQARGTQDPASMPKLAPVN